MGREGDQEKKGKERGEREKDLFGCLTRGERAHVFKKKNRLLALLLVK